MKGKTIAESIAWAFEHRTSEAHREMIEAQLDLSPEQFDRAIGDARDILKIDADLSLTPIYEREGWWTARPTHRIALRAEHESWKRMTGEAERNARVLAGFGRNGEIGQAAAMIASAVNGFESWIVTLGAAEVSAELDYVLTAVDQAIERGDRFVAWRQGAERLAA